MSDTEMMKLYSGRILELAADIPHVGRLENPQATVRKRSPLCGSVVTVDVVMADGRIAEFAQDVKACALGQAAAAIVGHAIIGCTAAELGDARDALHKMLSEEGPVPPAPFDGFAALQPARDFRNRHASILLAITAAAEAAETA
ncbi:iron-sulfur cluster assembly scaffold protein (plasmid) [Pseudorhodobacter turbinis]|uniref:Iron-sulfur cluster assembly scaffold protein n=1 Tax=Pseudorhodobacter turbinis TaxID=2500533 RepID=A0A4P8EIX0_9RHOB|nr:iron-sulfur cluster assembly scaffold protein [Pseudorhodobacter turbinis]QCO56898.1 iron-sulfur cluster assembly scaffold protein [Pseudorhodobacter turbinis]